MLGVLFAAALANAAPAPCPPEPRAAQVAADWLAKRPQGSIAINGPDQARCFQQAFVEALGPQIGPQVGYKIGLWSQGGRASYHTDRPVLGVLHARMLLPNGATVPAAYGVAPAWESDFILVVKDDGINWARNRDEVYAHLRGFRPFIELGARNYAPEVAVTVDQLTALDVSARLGVLGDEVPLPSDPAGLLAAAVAATVTNASGESIDRGRMLETLGDPIDAVAYVRDEVLRRGDRLKAGDLISIGASTPAKPPKPGQSLTVTYDLGGAPATATVHFQ